jgi:hypothetical protein
MDDNDLKIIGDLIDNKLDSKLEKFEKNLDVKLDSRLGKFEKNLDRKMDNKFSNFAEEVVKLIDIKIKSSNKNLEQKMFDWKSEIIDAVDGLASEIRDNRELREIGGHRIAENTKRIERLEKKVFGPSL